MAIDRIRQMTVEEYFAFDEASDTTRYEYIDGEAIAYERWHTSTHVPNCGKRNAASFRQLLKGSSHCRVHQQRYAQSRISPSRYVYPEFSVVCGENQLTDERFL